MQQTLSGNRSGTIECSMCGISCLSSVPLLFILYQIALGIGTSQSVKAICLLFSSAVLCSSLFQSVTCPVWSSSFCWYHYSVTLGWLHGGGCWIRRTSGVRGEYCSMKQSFQCRRFDDLNREGKYRLSQFCRKIYIYFFYNNWAISPAVRVQTMELTWQWRDGGAICFPLTCARDFPRNFNGNGCEKRSMLL